MKGGGRGGKKEGRNRKMRGKEKGKAEKDKMKHILRSGFRL